MIVVCYLVPRLIGLISEILEKWDFAAEFLHADLSKKFYTMMANMVFFMIIIF